jgi:Zinc dependent phospholipase C
VRTARCEGTPAAGAIVLLMRAFLVATLSVAVVAMPRPASAWGFEVHKFILAKAIPLLPPEIRPFFEKHHDAIVEHSIDPDLWRTAGWLEEPPRHFVDMDAYGPYPFKDLPRNYEEAVKRYGKDFVDKNGTLPWRTEEIFLRLAEAFEQRAPYARENIRFFSSVIGHYAADAHVPFHAALNYDGQLTGQWGIHARFETELFLRYRNTLRIEPKSVGPVTDVREYIFETLTASFPLVQPILDADKSVVGGKEYYDDAYFAQFFERVRPVLERRLNESITAVASVIAAAWTRAGKPTLPVDEVRMPRKVRRQ